MHMWSQRLTIAAKYHHLQSLTNLLYILHIRQCISLFVKPKEWNGRKPQRGRLMQILVSNSLFKIQPNILQRSLMFDFHMDYVQNLDHQTPARDISLAQSMFSFLESPAFSGGIFQDIKSLCFRI